MQAPEIGINTMRRPFVLTLLTAALALLITPGLQAQLAVPAYNSRPGAPYTVYLNFTGFSFTGTWGGSSLPSGTPGVTPAYDSDGNAASFSPGELADIQRIWARAAAKYAPFNVNVTTVDPAPGGSTDFQRQAFYDQTAQMMHTVIGGNGAWTGGGGVSFIGVTAGSFPPAGQNGGAGAGFHTNWVFSALAATNLQFVAEDAAHENGHGFGLRHQSDYAAGNVLLNEYSRGSGGTTGGAGTVAPIMGDSYYAERGTWRRGTARPSGAIQNDPAILLSNANMTTFINDGIGRTLGAATPLSMTGNNINPAFAKGVIVPASSASPNPLGVANYNSAFFSFSTIGGNVSITLNAGSEFITTGVADPGATLDGSLFILNSAGTVLFSSVTPSLSETINANLAAGNYFIRVDSAGGKTAGSLEFPTAVNTDYYDMGSYFLTGVIPVPEPATIALCAAILGLAGYQGWRVRRNRLKALDQNI